MIKKISITLLTLVTLFCSFGGIATVQAGSNNFGWVLEETVNTNNEMNVFDRLQKFTFGGGQEGVRNFLAYLAIKILIPVMTWIGIVIAIIGFYKMMTSDSDEQFSKGKDYILRGLLGVVIMVSAGYITNQLVGGGGEGEIIAQITAGESGAAVAQSLYDHVFFPILKLFIFLVLGVLFLLVLGNGLKYIFSNDESIQNKSLTVLLYNALGIFVIILAKSMVEAFYGTYQEVTNASIDNIGEVGQGIFTDPIQQFSSTGGLYAILNWILGITTFIIVVILVYQGYQILVKPADEEMIKSLKTNIIYIFVGVAIIGAGYLIGNFFIVT